MRARGITSLGRVMVVILAFSGLAFLLTLVAFRLGVIRIATDTADEQPPAADGGAVGFRPGPAWKGRAQGVPSPTMTQEDIESFDRFPLLWLGASFAGYNLHYVAQAGDGVTGIYGVCRELRGCPGAIQIQNRSVCWARPERIADVVKMGGLETVRAGALLQRMTDGSIRLWTGRTNISLWALFDPSRIDDAVQALQGASRDVQHIGPGDPLPPPDYSGC